MSDEEWETSPQTQTWSYFAKRDPRVEGKKKGFIDPLIYQRWSKAERDIYKRFKATQIREAIAKKNLKTIDELSSAFDSLSVLAASDPEPDPDISQILDQIQKLRIDHDK